MVYKDISEQGDLLVLHKNIKTHKFNIIDIVSNITHDILSHSQTLFKY